MKKKKDFWFKSERGLLSYIDMRILIVLMSVLMILVSITQLIYLEKTKKVEELFNRMEVGELFNRMEDIEYLLLSEDVCKSCKDVYKLKSVIFSDSLENYFNNCLPTEEWRRKNLLLRKNYGLLFYKCKELEEQYGCIK